MRPDRFVVGYAGKKEIVYGNSNKNLWPMTEHQARAELKDFPQPGATIYELVAVELPAPKRKEAKK